MSMPFDLSKATGLNEFHFICNCEMDIHFRDIHPKSEAHEYGAEVSGKLYLAKEVGEICSDCANSHYKQYVIDDSQW